MDAGDAAARQLEVLSEAFAELVAVTMGEFDVHELLQVLVDRCVDALGVTASGLMLAKSGSDLQLLVASDQRAELLELFQIQHDEGPCLEAYRGGAAVVAKASEGELDRWPHFGRACVEAGFDGVIAVPMRVDGGVVGGLNLFGTSTVPVPTITTARIAESMAKVAAIAIEKDQAARDRETLIAQLETALESRIVVEQAKGALATHLDVGVDEAFALLRQRARSSRRPLRDVAAEVVRTGGQDFSARAD